MDAEADGEIARVAIEIEVIARSRRAMIGDAGFKRGHPRMIDKIGFVEKSVSFRLETGDGIERRGLEEHHADAGARELIFAFDLGDPTPKIARIGERR